MNLIKILVFAILTIGVFTLSARGTHLKENDVTKPSISSYKIRVVVNKEPDPSPTVNRYRIVAYVYADNDTTINVPIPTPITVTGQITWNGGVSYYPINITISYSGITSQNFECNKPDELTANTLEYLSLSTYSLGGIPVSFDGLYFQ
ncbi:hypothetical protein [Sphingobacterium haloxyli]|uniref:Uncharacterized protein n=1 Tax=Sphingobacterium haloxyli TaxID=2100533 RepID=A0A2S9J958_9SPHI|nr:hypothetical protein [Sphingobacterium haloxyli]PRD49335.1 hypothetical protein C5745_01545 [Sphingobacterium haloxyli]